MIIYNKKTAQGWDEIERLVEEIKLLSEKVDACNSLIQALRDARSKVVKINSILHAKGKELAEENKTLRSVVVHYEKESERLNIAPGGSFPLGPSVALKSRQQGASALIQADLIRHIDALIDVNKKLGVTNGKLNDKIHRQRKEIARLWEIMK